jgi:predicted adenine nucleotide alpha hydrolase (AANH) superfamily ATPase
MESINRIQVKKILLHACCGPCATAVIEKLLAQRLSISVIYHNDNITDKAEYDKRLEALAQVCRYYSIPLTASEYDHDRWLDSVRGLESEPERGGRCVACFAHNFRFVAEAAQKMGIPLWTTTLSVSPYKSLPMIDKAAEGLAGYKSFDFKKENGFARTIILSRDLNIYRQDFCGCEFSARMNSKEKAHLVEQD